jgi:pyrophosphatase PpaX
MITQKQDDTANPVRAVEPPFSPLRCVIFDMDGTLTQTNRLIFDAFNHVVEQYQKPRMTDLEITALFGPPEEGALVKIVGEENLQPALDEYLRYYRAHHRRLARLYPGMIDVVRFLHQRGTRLAIFTGKGTHTTRITLEECGIAEYFDMIVTGNDVVQHKPSAEGIRKIISHFQLNPDEVLMVGDSVSDVKASHEAGVKIAAVLWDSYGKEHVMRMQTDYVFHDVTELHRWLETKVA